MPSPVSSVLNAASSTVDPEGCARTRRSPQSTLSTNSHTTHIPDLLMIFTDALDLLHSDRLTRIAPTVAHIRQHVGHLFISQSDRWHDAVVWRALDHHGSR